MADTHEIEIGTDDCAVVFRKDGTMDVVVPSLEEGSSVPPQMLYTLLVQELLKDQYMVKVLVDRLIEGGIMDHKEAASA